MQRPLLLNGFMATGKSVVGARVAARTGRPFVDLDARVEALAGRSVPELFAERGEREFRKLERAALLGLLAAPGPPPVIALGGGALLARDLRLLALDAAVVVTLEAKLETLLARLGDCVGRPLLRAEGRAERAEALIEARAVAYAECHARLATDGRSLEALAAEVERIWARDPIAVAAGLSSYSIEVGVGIAEQRLPPTIGSSSRTVLVSDDTVFDLHGGRIASRLENPVVVTLRPGEQNKHIGAVEAVWRAALAGSADRKACFVALGGGVVTDMTGFAAGTYMRGVRWIAVPSTLLAMVDAAVGGKTGVDLLDAKNAVGAFWQPSGVICDVALLETERPRALRSALAEVVKTALVGDPELLHLVESRATSLKTRPPELMLELVRRALRVKARVVSADERENDVRAVLNLGHTVGHVLEAVAGYARLTHGEAVSLGLVAALRIGERLGVTPAELTLRVTALLDRLGLPTNLRAEPLVDAVRLLGHDKKRAGATIRFIFTPAAGEVCMHELELAVLEREVLALAS